MFAMLTSKGHFSVKLPEDRAAGLVQSGKGIYFEMGGHRMKQWLVIPGTSALDWKSIANEAYTFVAGNA